MASSILIIEHNAARRTLLETLLRGDAEAVETVDSGDAALLRLGMTDFGCIIIGSPISVDFDGEESTLLELFDRMAPNLASRLIVITHPAATAVLRRSLQLQVYAIFLDPFDAAALRDAVQRCIRREEPPLRFYGKSDVVAARRH